MTKLILLVALAAVAVSSLVEAVGVLDLLKSSIKGQKSPYSHNAAYSAYGGDPYEHYGHYSGSELPSSHGSRYAVHGSPYESHGSHYDSTYGAHQGHSYVEPGYGVNTGYGYNPYSRVPQHSPYGASYGGYSANQLDYTPSHIPAPVYGGHHSSSHGSSHLLGGHHGNKYGHLHHHSPVVHHAGRHHSSGGSASSSAAAGPGEAAAAAAAGGSSASASAPGVGEVHHHGSKYGHLSHHGSHGLGHHGVGHHGAGLHGAGHLGAGPLGVHYDGALHGSHGAGHLQPHVNVGVDFELGGHHEHDAGHHHDLSHGLGSSHHEHGGVSASTAVGGDYQAAASTVNQPEVYHNTELLPDGHKTSIFVDYQEKPIEQTMASASGTFSTDDQGIERSSYSRSTEHVQNKEDGHIDDDHYYQAQSYGKTHDDNLHEASNRDDEDYEVTPTGYRKKKRKGNYVKNHTKTTRETGSGVLAKDRHQAGFSKSVNKLVENVNKNKVSTTNGVAHDENLSSSQNIDDGDEDFYDSDLARRGHNIPGPHVPRGTSAASSSAASGSAVGGPGGAGASAASAAGPGGVSSSVAASG